MNGEIFMDQTWPHFSKTIKLMFIKRKMPILLQIHNLRNKRWGIIRSFQKEHLLEANRAIRRKNRKRIPPLETTGFQQWEMALKWVRSRCHRFWSICNTFKISKTSHQLIRHPQRTCHPTCKMLKKMTKEKELALQFSQKLRQLKEMKQANLNPYTLTMKTKMSLRPQTKRKNTLKI